LLDGVRKETEAPIGAEVPRIVGWLSPSGRRDRAVWVEAEEEGVWSVEVSVPDDVLVRVDVNGGAQ